ncbi:MAG: hypothetical protein LC122_14290 [Chitinophagales bacterium]|nr:hypothetical protein [Chitinophagales bacterium]
MFTIDTCFIKVCPVCKEKLNVSKQTNIISMRSLDFEISLYEEFYNDYKPILEKLIKIFELN